MTAGVSNNLNNGGHRPPLNVTLSIYEIASTAATQFVATDLENAVLPEAGPKRVRI